MENKNLLLAFIASFGIIYLYDMFSPTVKSDNTKTEQVNVVKKEPTQESIFVQQIVNEKITPISVKVDTEKFNGDLLIEGDKVTGMQLRNFEEDVGSEARVVLLRDSNYTISSGFISGNNNVIFNWKLISGDTLTMNNPIKLAADLGNGITVLRTISVDEKYALTFTTEIINASGQSLKIYEKNEITKTLTDKDSGGTWTLNEGATGYLDGDLIENNFDDIKKKNFAYSGHIDWAGLTDKYWLVSLINPSRKAHYNINYSLLKNDEKHPSYRATFEGDNFVINAGENRTFKTVIFVGPKDINLLDEYEEKYDIRHFDLAIDYGKLYFITKPILYFLNYINSIFGSMGWTILFLTILIKLVLFPFANKSYKSMARMRVVQPKIKALQQLYANDKQRLGQEMMMLYKREKVNPLGGCLPSLMQFPILFALYKVLMICFGMRHASFLWIDDLAAPEPYSVFNLFGLLPFEVPSFLMIGTWALLMGGSMFLQQKMTPQVAADPQQEKMFMFMPIFLMFMMSGFPVGLLIYWTLSNLFSIVQQYYVTRTNAR